MQPSKYIHLAASILLVAIVVPSAVLAQGRHAASEAKETNKTERTGSQQRVAIDLTDGSRIVGVPSVTHLPVQTPYGKIDVALGHIVSISIKADHETGLFEMQNGDRLTGVLNLRQIELTTILGNVSIKIPDITSIHCGEKTNSVQAEVVRLLSTAKNEDRKTKGVDIVCAAHQATKVMVNDAEVVQFGNDWISKDKVQVAPGDIIAVRVDFGGSRNFFWLQDRDQLFQTNTQSWFQYVPEDSNKWWVIETENIKRLHVQRADKAKLGGYLAQAKQATIQEEITKTVFIGSSLDHDGYGYMFHIVTEKDLGLTSSPGKSSND
jgi:hypothetical protein